MSDLHLVTGHKGEAHITAVDHGSLNAAVFGEGDYVLNRGNKFSASYIGNNTIRVLDGDLVIQGRHVRLAAGSTADIAITTISSSYKRNTLICAKYTRNTSTGVESCELVAMNGTTTLGTPKDPAVTTGNVLTGAATTHYFPLYRVLVSGATIGTPEQLFDVVEVVKVGADGKIAESFLPEMDYIKTSQKGASSGVAPLDSEKKVPAANLPVSDSPNTNSSTTIATSAAVKKVYDMAGGYVSDWHGDNGIYVSSHKCGRVVVCTVKFEVEEDSQQFTRVFSLHYKPCYSEVMAAACSANINGYTSLHCQVEITKNSLSATFDLYTALSIRNYPAYITFTYFTEE